MRLDPQTHTAPAGAQEIEAARVVEVVAPHVRSVWPDEAAAKMHRAAGFRQPVRTQTVVDRIWFELLERVTAHSPNAGSKLHDREHWKRVYKLGRWLGAKTPGADLDVIALFALFALFHDAIRANDGDDPGHGANGARLAHKMRHGWKSVRVYYDGRERQDPLSLPITDEQFEQLDRACRHHTDGMMALNDPTIGCCWDADRLDLFRVNMKPRAALLSTEAARAGLPLLTAALG